jgi:hypothetical protein
MQHSGLQKSRPILQQALAAVGIVADRLTDVALQFAPEGASPQVVRTAVSGGLVLLALSFVKGILSFILTIGTVVFGAYVAVRVFGLDVQSVSGSRTSDSMGSGPRQRSGGSKRRANRYQAPDRQEKSGMRGLLDSLTGNIVSDEEEDDGLLDVWFPKNARGTSKNKKRK